MRHIPEDELHAYLDQALSRTQCVEIESHLAECPSCRGMRDGIAALRDRTTALLAKLAPPTRPLPPYERLRHVAAEVASRRRRRLQLFAWAASLVAAVGLGWSASSFMRSEGPGADRPAIAAVPGGSGRSVPAAARPDSPSSAAIAQADEPVPAPPARPRPPQGTTEPRATPASSRASSARAGRAPTSRSGEAVAPSRDSVQALREATLRVLSPTPALELTNLESTGRQDDLGGMWRTMSWDGAKAEAGELPHIDGLPVVQVQVQSGDQSASAVTVVAQQLASGQVIRTIEGPATDVSQILSRHGLAETDAPGLLGDSGRRINDGGHAMAMQVGDRMLAITGDLPSDSLRAMIRRLNAEMRSK
jgi:hypothetical protein